jgi:hypothetical protein
MLQHFANPLEASDCVEVLQDRRLLGSYAKQSVAISLNSLFSVFHLQQSSPTTWFIIGSVSCVPRHACQEQLYHRDTA